jgi:UDP-N-acetyl-D-mannosaminuronic acid dehydrogenase
MGINVYDVRNGVDSLKGEGITRAVLYPGAGVGGHCLTKDTYHLERGVKISTDTLDYPAGQDSLFVLARKVNDFMPVHMCHLTLDALSRAGKNPKSSKVAMLGWAFINDSDDARNPPSEPYRDLLLDAGCKVEVHDPHVMEYPGVNISHELSDVLRDADVIAIMTGHSEYFKLEPLATKNLMGQDHPVIVDGRNVVEPDDYINAGFVYKGIGRGDKNSHPIQ